MDTYTIYSASALAATVILRSTCAAAFPLFSPTLYAALGDQWACSVFAFLALACMPMPWLFWVREGFGVHQFHDIDEKLYTEIWSVDPQQVSICIQGI